MQEEGPRKQGGAPGVGGSAWSLTGAESLQDLSSWYSPAARGWLVAGTARCRSPQHPRLMPRLAQSLHAAGAQETFVERTS